MKKEVNYSNKDKKGFCHSFGLRILSLVNSGTFKRVAKWIMEIEKDTKLAELILDERITALGKVSVFLSKRMSNEYLPVSFRSYEQSLQFYLSKKLPRTENEEQAAIRQKAALSSVYESAARAQKNFDKVFGWVVQ